MFPYRTLSHGQVRALALQEAFNSDVKTAVLGAGKLLGWKSKDEGGHGGRRRSGRRWWTRIAAAARGRRRSRARAGWAWRRCATGCIGIVHRRRGPPAGRAASCRYACSARAATAQWPTRRGRGRRWWCVGRRGLAWRCMWRHRRRACQQRQNGFRAQPGRSLLTLRKPPETAPAKRVESFHLCDLRPHRVKVGM